MMDAMGFDVMQLGYGFAFGFLSAGAFALFGFLAAQDPEAKEKPAFDWRKFLYTAVIGGIAGVCFITLGMDADAVSSMLALMGVGATGPKVIKVLQAVMGVATNFATPGKKKK